MDTHTGHAGHTGHTGHTGDATIAMLREVLGKVLGKINDIISHDDNGYDAHDLIVAALAASSDEWLERHDAELRKERDGLAATVEVAVSLFERARFMADRQNLYCWLELEDTQARIESISDPAAILAARDAASRKDCFIRLMGLLFPGREVYGFSEDDALVGVGPEDCAIQFQGQRDAAKITDGANGMLDSIRASLRNFPLLGGDIEVMKTVERLIAEGRKAGLEEAFQTINDACSYLDAICKLRQMAQEADHGGR